VIGHPYNLKHLVRYFKFFKPEFKLPSEEFLLRIFEITPSYKSYDIKGFRATSGKTTDGYFIMCPIVPDMLAIKPEKVIEKVIQACRVAENLGIGVATLGGFSSIAGEKYSRVLSDNSNVALTTGNTLTVYMVMEGIRKACQLMDVDLDNARVTVIGGSGDIGGACARLLATRVKEITITGRNEKNLMETERMLSYLGKAKVKTSRDNNQAVRGADLVIAAASASSAIVDFENFKPGAVICDVGYPKNISYTMCHRNDIFIFSGGLTKLPADFDLGFDIGLPSTRILYGCFAEAIVLDLEERYENYSWGKGNITEERVNLIGEMATRHGFELSPLFWGIRLMSDAAIERIKENVKTGERSSTVKNVSP
jgi:predicted amino acid dehydrogenase